MSSRPIYNYPLPPHFYSTNDHRSIAMASQYSTGSEGSEWSNITSKTYQSSARGSSQCPSSHNTSRSSHTASSVSRVPSSPSEKSDKEPPQPQYCPHSDCTDVYGRPNRAFTRKADVQRHYTSTHEKTLVDCPKPRCARKGVQGFTRSDHLTEHLRGYHRESIAKRQSSTSTSSHSGGSPQY